MTTSAATKQLELAPYIFFYGRCEEALEFYKQALNGSYDLMRVADSPMADDVPAEARNNVMHATFNGPGFSFMASDGQGARAIDPDAGNITLSLATSDAAEGDRVFKALAEIKTKGGTNMYGAMETAFKLRACTLLGIDVR